MTRHRLGRIVLRIVVVSAAVVLVCIVLIAFGLFPQGWLHDLVEHEVRNALGPQSRIGRLHVVPGRLRADASDVVIEGRGFRMEIARLRLALAWPTITGRSISLRSIEAERPVLTLWPVEPLDPPPPVTPIEKAVLIGDIRVTNGTLIYKDPSLGGDWRVDGLTLTGGIGEKALRLDTGPVRWERPEPLVLEPMHGTLTISPLLAARLDSLEIATQRSQLSASGELGELLKPQPDVTVRLKVDLADAAFIAPTAPPMSGIVTGEARVTGMGAALESTGHIDGRGIRVSGQGIDRVAARYTLRGGRTQATFDAAAFGGSIKGNADLHGAAIEAIVDGTNLDLRRLTAAGASDGAGVSGRATLHASARGRMGERIETAIRLEASGQAATNLTFTAQAEAGGAFVGADNRADLQWKASGTADQPVDPNGRPSLQGATWTASGTMVGAWPAAIDGRLEGTGRMVSAVGTSPFNVTGSVQTRGGTSTAALDVTGDLGLINVRAVSNGAGTTVDASARDIRLERIVADTRGVARFAFQGSGRGESFRGTGEGDIADLHWQQTRLGAVAFKVTTAGRETRLSARVPDLRVQADTILAPVRAGSADLAVSAHIELRDSPLGLLGPYVPGENPVTGRLTATLDVPATPTAALARARVDGRVEQLSVTSGKLAASTKGPFTFQATSDAVMLRDLSVSGDGFSLQVTGNFGVTPRAPFNATVRGDVDLARLPVPSEWNAGGTAHADVTLTGTAERPRATGSIDFRELTASGPGVPPVQVEAAQILLAGDTIRFPDLTATVAGGRVRLSGLIPIDTLNPRGTGRGTAHLDLLWEGIDVGQVHAAAMPTATVAVAGKLDGEAHVEGSLLTPKGIVARVRTPPATLTVGEMPLSLSGLVLDVRDGRATLTNPLDVGTERGSLHVTGGADLVARTLAISTTGHLDLRALSPMMTDAALGGRAELDLTLSGPFAAPRPQGRMVIARGSLRTRDIQPGITGIEGPILFEGSQVRIPETTADWGGGTLKISGEATLKGALVEDVRIALAAHTVALRYQGTRVQADSDLTITGRTGALQLGGTVNILRALYDKDIYLDESIRAPALEKANASPILDTVALQLEVRMAEPFIVRNNLAEVQVEGSLNVRGTAFNPEPFGRLELLEDGTVLLQGHEFRVPPPDDAVNTLTFDGSMDPRLNIHVVSSKPVKWSDGDGQEEGDFNIAVTGTLRVPELKISAVDGELSEFEAMSILLTGRKNPGQNAGWMVGEQAAMLLAGRATRQLSHQLQRLGFDEVTIEPNLVAQEDKPGARFTFGKNLTSWSSLVYSLGLDNAEERFFRLEVRPIRNLSGDVRRTDDGLFTGSVRHQLRLGETRRARPSKNETVLEEIRFGGRLPEEEAVLREWLKARPGDKVQFWNLQDDTDRLRQKLVERRFLEAQVNVRLEGAVAIFAIRPGGRYGWKVEGMPAPPDLTGTLRDALFAEEALVLGEKRLVEELRHRGHLRAEVHGKIVEPERTSGSDTASRRDPTTAAAARSLGPIAPGKWTVRERTLVFEAVPGPLYAGADVTFQGASAFSTSTLVNAAGGAGELVTQPAAARQRIEERYHEAYYLSASVGAPQLTENGPRLAIRVPVDEGPQAHIAAVTFHGHTLPEWELTGYVQDLVGLQPDEVMTMDAVTQIRTRYFSLGYPAVRITTRLLPTPPNIELRFDIAEGERVRIREIVVEDGARISPDILKRQLPFSVGDPVDPAMLSAAESALLKHGVAGVTIRSDENDAGRVIVKARPAPRAVLRYAAQIDNTAAPGFAVDGRLPNVFRNGLSPGGSFEQSSDLRKARGWIQLPAFFHRGLFNLSVGQQKEWLLIATDLRPRRAERGEPTYTLTTGEISAIQTLELRRRWRIDYGYEMKRVITEHPAFVEPVKIDIGAVTTSFLRDTRDDLLDARRGRFWSITFKYAPPALGSDVSFAKTYAQVYAFRELTPNVVWAQAYRVGVGFGLNGNGLPVTENFTAGGAHSLRGFDTESLGPRPEGASKGGGEATLILSQELRYHMRSGLGAVIFSDFGNVYGNVSDIGFPMQYSVGTGLRYASPVGLLRLDFAVPIKRREDDDAYRIYLSLGQAF